MSLEPGEAKIAGRADSRASSVIEDVGFPRVLWEYTVLSNEKIGTVLFNLRLGC